MKPNTEKMDEPKMVDFDSGMASCSVKPPSSVKIGTKRDPPPMPAADERTVTMKVAQAVWRSCKRNP